MCMYVILYVYRIYMYMCMCVCVCALFLRVCSQTADTETKELSMVGRNSINTQSFTSHTPQ